MLFVLLALSWLGVGASGAAVPCAATALDSGTWSNESIWFAASRPDVGLAVRIEPKRAVTVAASQSSGSLEIGDGATLLMAPGVALAVSAQVEKGIEGQHGK